MRSFSFRIFGLASLFAGALFLVGTCAGAAELKVPSQYGTIQEAVDNASAGDKIVVAPGEYHGNIKLKEGVILQGAGADSTTIVGSGTGSVIEGAKNAVVEGFTITGSGKKGSIGTTMDAGISANNSPMTIANNRIVGNNTGIKLYYSPSHVLNNEISGSEHYGIYLSYSNSNVRNNIIRDNKSYGIYVSYSKPEITNNTIYNNLDGIYSEVSHVVVKNNIISGNKEAGIRWAEFIGSQESAEPVLSYNLLWNNNKDRVNVKPAEGDVSSDPRFADPGAGDFRLSDGSPAKGAGEGGVDLGAFGGDEAQPQIPMAPSKKSYASLKPDFGVNKEPDYLSQNAWQGGTKSGKGNFESYCVPCHGPLGKGDGILADTLDVKPRNLSNAKLLSMRTDDFLFKVIKNGGASVGFSENMMPFDNTLSDEEIKNVIRYIRSDICKCQYKGE